MTTTTITTKKMMMYKLVSIELKVRLPPAGSVVVDLWTGVCCFLFSSFSSPSSTCGVDTDNTHRHVVFRC